MTETLFQRPLGDELKKVTDSVSSQIASATRQDVESSDYVERMTASATIGSVDLDYKTAAVTTVERSSGTVAVTISVPIVDNAWLVSYSPHDTPKRPLKNATFVRSAESPVIAFTWPESKLDNESPAALKKWGDTQFNVMGTWITRINKDVDRHNKSLDALVSKAVAERIKWLDDVDDFRNATKNETVVN